MDSFLNAFMSQVLPELVVVIGSLVALALLAVRTKIFQLIASKVESQAVASALTWASNLAVEMVYAAQQTQVDGIKKALADGKLTKAEYDEVLAATKKAVLEKLKASTLGVLLSSGAAKTLTDADSLATDLIESAVKKIKIVGPNP